MELCVWQGLVSRWTPSSMPNKQGRSAEEIAQDYPSVPKSAIYATIAYYLSAQEDVDAYLRARQDQAERVRAEVEQWSPSTGLRQRLLERRKASRSEPTRQAPGGSP